VVLPSQTSCMTCWMFLDLAQCSPRGFITRLVLLCAFLRWSILGRSWTACCSLKQAGSRAMGLAMCALPSFAAMSNLSSPSLWLSSPLRRCEISQWFVHTHTCAQAQHVLVLSVVLGLWHVAVNCMPLLHPDVHPRRSPLFNCRVSHLGQWRACLLALWRFWIGHSLV